MNWLRSFIARSPKQATVVGKTLLLAALGLRLLDGEGHDLPDGGESLERLARAEPGDLDPRLRELRLTIACDVTNPLAGARGAGLRAFWRENADWPCPPGTCDTIRTLDELLRLLVLD